MPAFTNQKIGSFLYRCKAKGIKVYHLNIGQPDIETPQSALDALKDIHLKVLEYSLSEGNIEYREQLAKYYNKIGFADITPKTLLLPMAGLKL